MKTNVHFILDRSGSMESCKEQTISGFNKYIGTLKKDEKNEYAMTLTLFDDVVDVEYKNLDIKEVKELNKDTFIPRGTTALYDAVCSTVKKVTKVCQCNECEKCGAPLKEKNLVVIMTDGGENSSMEYTQKDLNKMVKELEKENFTFVFLGANQDSYETASHFGVNVANTLNYGTSAAGVGAAFRGMGVATMAYASNTGGGGGVAMFNSSQKEDIEKHSGSSAK